MKDRMERTIDYLRISVTDRCNLRCVYCMPEEGVESLKHTDILSFDEILRVCRVMAGQGLKKIKLTGGEPLVRRGILSLIRQLKDIPGIEQVTLTTNGVLLTEMAEGLADAGIDAVTVSLDTLDRERFQQITRRDELQRVKDGIAAIQKYPQVNVKLNCLLQSEPEDLLAVAEYARNAPIHVRFIEVMPIGYGSQMAFRDEAWLMELLEGRFGPLLPYEKVLGNGPAVYYSAEGFMGKLGFISAVSHKFCDRCNRVRLTSDGFLKTCLQYDLGVQLKPVLRGGGGDEELWRLIQEAVWNKPRSHHFDKRKAFEDRENRTMSQIGG